MGNVVEEKLKEIQKCIEDVLNEGFLWKPNDAMTRDAIKRVLTDMLYKHIESDNVKVTEDAIVLKDIQLLALAGFHEDIVYGQRYAVIEAGEFMGFVTYNLNEETGCPDVMYRPPASGVDWIEMSIKIE